MRNLKKILALVLALMMVVSMMVTASATSFADDADINSKYYEAVSVLSGIGVIRGVENADGTFNFNPKGALNRAQAATIISYVLEGTLDTIADEVSIYENPFTDVPEWAVPYVLYAHSNGIIVGRNETTYDPNATITGYELGKMLLISAFGYDNYDFLVEVYVVDGKAYTTEAEAFVASLNAGGAAITTKSIARNDWQVVVASGLKDNGVWNNEFKLSKKLTREEACFLAFNTVMNSTLDEDVFGLAVGADVDEFGRTTKTYTSTVLEDLDIALPNYKTPTVFVATANADATVAGLNTLLNLTGDKVLKSDSLTAYTNGATNTDGIKIGDTVEYYVDAEGKVTKIVLIRETLETADVAATAEADGDYKGLYEVTFGAGVTYAAKDTYTDGASYMVVLNGTKVLDVNVPTVISKAKITKADTAAIADATYVVVNDQKLVKGNGYACTVTGGTAAFGTEYDYVLNSNGYLVAIADHNEIITEVDLETGYAYLLGAEKKVTTNAAASSLIGGSTAYSWDVVAVAKLALTDGTVAIVNLNTEITKNKTTGAVTGLKINGVESTIANDSAPVDQLDVTVPAAGWVEFEIQEDGSYKLAERAATTSVNLKKDTAKIGDDQYTTNATVWTHYEINTTTGVITTTKNVGFGSYPSTAANFDAILTANKDHANVITKIDSFGTYEEPDAATNTIYECYYIGGGEYVLGVQAKAFYYNGTKVNLFTADEMEDGSLTLEEGNVYNLVLNEDGQIVKVIVGKNMGTVIGGEVEYIDDSIVVIDGIGYTYYNTEIYNVENGTGAVDTLEVGDIVTIYRSSTYISVSAIYITDAK